MVRKVIDLYLMLTRGTLITPNYSNFIKKIMIFDRVKLNIMLIRLFR